MTSDLPCPTCGACMSLTAPAARGILLNAAAATRAALVSLREQWERAKDEARPELAKRHADGVRRLGVIEGLVDRARGKQP